ncbi:unnamed protein product [Effrenium voratum]|uniref:Uncharacterized protein n=1 Tax=Effrenium voratum TaxID=2562239 RepID=A0AA36ILL5_9DINO|nr:unnamed protein product [Effrenium voratum]
MAWDVRGGVASWGKTGVLDLSPSARSARSTRTGKSTASAHSAKDVAGRSECWEAFLLQARAAQATRCFVFSHRRLDGVAASALGKYLQEECSARFVDLSFLKRWEQVDAVAAAALKQGLRPLRSLSLDGNCIDAELWHEALQVHPGLQHLSLQKTNLTDAHAPLFAELLREPLMFSLDLGCNDISDAGAATLLEALQQNNVLLELGLEGTKTSEPMRQNVQALLERNARLYQGARPVDEVLRGLRRAQAEAATGQAQLTEGVAEIESQAASTVQSPMSSPRHPRSRKGDATPAAVLDLSRGIGAFCAAELEEEEDEREEPSLEQEMADQVWFDADDGRRLLAELNLRCEAGWRYSAADQEEMVRFREMIKELQELRVREKQRHEEALQRLAEAQRSFNQRMSPMQKRSLELQKQIEAVQSDVAAAHQQKFFEEGLLRDAQRDLEVEQEELAQEKLAGQRVVSSLRLRHHEMAENLQEMHREQGLLEANIDFLLGDNERCRRALHAVRFETETERFVPHSILGRLGRDLVNVKGATSTP